MKHEFPSVRIPKGAKILSARFILADENYKVTEDISVTKDIQEIIDRPEWKSGGRLRLVLEDKNSPYCLYEDVCFLSVGDVKWLV